MPRLLANALILLASVSPTRPNTWPQASMVIVMDEYRAPCRPVSLRRPISNRTMGNNQDDAKQANSAVRKSVAVSPIGDEAASPQSAEEQQDQEDDQDDGVSKRRRKRRKIERRSRRWRIG